MDGAAGLSVMLDRANINRAMETITRAEIGADGSFEINMPDGLDAGIYFLRFGAKRLTLILDDNTGLVRVNGQLANLQSNQVEIVGSTPSKVFSETMRKISAREMGADDIQTFVDTTSNPLVGMFLAYKTLAGNGAYLDVQRSAEKKVAAAFPDSPYAKDYKAWITAVDAQYKAQQAQELIKVGNMAPDIKLPSPDGTEYSLSDLKGKVVLLDFWASWCGPCRRENPNVVKVYDRYKDDGFTVYSVSLDRQGQKQRWVDAIKKDNLKWPYHVSDLQYWQSLPAKMYGVRGIPRTFLIDREGKIAAVGLRGAAQIENELKKVL